MNKAFTPAGSFYVCVCVCVWGGVDAVAVNRLILEEFSYRFIDVFRVTQRLT